MTQLVKKTKDEKKKVLHEQLSLIQSEKEKVESQCEGLQVCLSRLCQIGSIMLTYHGSAYKYVF